MPEILSRKNTAAASVEATIEPRSRPSMKGEDDRGDDDADGREQHGRGCRLPEGLDRGAETGIEENDRQGDIAQHVGQAVIAELDTETIDACDQADAEKEQKDGRTEAESNKRRKGRQQNQRCADQYDNIECFQPASLLSPPVLTNPKHEGASSK
jgi:hypothetical protein